MRTTFRYRGNTSRWLITLSGRTNSFRNFQPHFPYFNDLKQLNVGLTLRRDLEMKDDTMAPARAPDERKAELRTVLAM
jgi:hypothetical protein